MVGSRGCAGRGGRVRGVRRTRREGKRRGTYGAGLEKANSLERFLDIGDFVAEAGTAALGGEFHELVFSGLNG